MREAGWSLDSTKLPDDFWLMAEAKREQQKNLVAEPCPNCQHTEL